MQARVFSAVLVALAIAACFAADSNSSTSVGDTRSTSSHGGGPTPGNASSPETLKPNNTASTGGVKANVLDIGVYSRAFYVLVALGGLVIIYLGAKAFWRTRRGRAAVPKSSSASPASLGRPATDSAGLMMVNDDEEDEESTVFDQSRERLLKSSRTA